MSELRDLYQEVIIDHGRNPRNFGAFPEANQRKEGFNPLCGDKITLHVLTENQAVKKIKFEGCGCAISMASASLMSETMKEKSFAEIQQFFENFHAVVTQGNTDTEKLGKLAVLAGVAEFPARVKCATLAWHTLNAILTNEVGIVCTEEKI